MRGYRAETDWKRTSSSVRQCQSFLPTARTRSGQIENCKRSDRILREWPTLTEQLSSDLLVSIAQIQNLQTKTNSFALLPLRTPPPKSCRCGFDWTHINDAD